MNGGQFDYIQPFKFRTSHLFRSTLYLTVNQVWPLNKIQRLLPGSWIADFDDWFVLPQIPNDTSRRKSRRQNMLNLKQKIYLPTIQDKKSRAKICWTWNNCCKLTLARDVTQEDAILAGKHFSQLHICTMEYWQLVTTITYANLLQILTLKYSQQNACFIWLTATYKTLFNISLVGVCLRQHTKHYLI